MKPWKLAEKEVAEKLGGTRRVRVSYEEKIEDVLHPRYALEVKYGNQVPAYCCVKILTSNGEYDLIPSSQWSWGIPPRRFKIQRITRDQFIVDGLAQACGYNPKKIPMLCVKAKGMQGFVIILRHSDYLRGDRELPMVWKDEKRV